MATASLISPVRSKMPSREADPSGSPLHRHQHQHHHQDHHHQHQHQDYLYDPHQHPPAQEHLRQRQRPAFLPPATLRDIDINYNNCLGNNGTVNNNSNSNSNSNNRNNHNHNFIYNRGNRFDSHGSPFAASRHSLRGRPPVSSAAWHARSQTLDNRPIVPSAAPDLASRSSRFSTPPKPRDLSSRASLLPTSNLHPALENLLDLDCAFGRPPVPDSPTESPPLSSGFPPQLHRQPTADGYARPETSLDDLSDDLSDYDDPNANDTSSATDIDDTPDQASGIEQPLSDSDLPSPLPMFAPKPSPPHLRLEQVNPAIIRQEGPRTLIDESPQSTSFGPPLVLNKPLPRSPDQSSTVPSVFGWGAASSGADAAPVARPLSSAQNSLAHDGRRSTKGSFASDYRTDASSIHLKYADTFLSMPGPASPAFSVSNTASMVDEMEDELKAISAELAASIRREMDLEDLVDKLQEQVNGSSQGLNKRSSDYFSDSGHSSAKLSDYDAGREEIDKIRRRSEQEKAAIRLELSNKLQDERSKRIELNRKIKELAEKASHVDIAQINSLDANDRIKGLEETCDDLKRKLSEERESKRGFEDILAALKGQLREVSDERDNLKDEVMPGLRTRIEGLETEAAGYSGLTYESARLQQQLQSLKQENSSLRSSIVASPEEPQMVKRASASVGLSRSNSLGPSALRGGPRQPPSALARSDSLKGAAGPSDTREDLAQRLKDVEAQRDALHGALKTLLERQEVQNREHLKKVRALENERQRLLLNPSRQGGFERDTSKLRVEVNVLRRRAEEALEEKWQVEKGLGGIKMDLDRAEEEIESLRNLLKESDILIPPSQFRASLYSAGGQQPVSSESLESAFVELRGARQDSAQESDRRMGELAAQVEQQLAGNKELRERLSAAVTVGETVHAANSQRIREMEEQLRNLEDQVVNAQMASEERVARHEEEMAKMQESSGGHLRRLHMDPGGGEGPERPSASGTPLGKSLRPVPSRSFEDEDEIKTLRATVAELEKTLAEADKEMQGIVAKMNRAQAEVLALQEAREAAVRETRRLEQAVRQERAGLGGSLGRA